ncbi:hypothetical protein GW17_00029706 [Ensete ventricosum]|nr:hypothetical protein GW17_00029706 [Ensete ventricosum]
MGLPAICCGGGGGRHRAGGGTPTPEGGGGGLIIPVGGGGGKFAGGLNCWSGGGGIPGCGRPCPCWDWAGHCIGGGNCPTGSDGGRTTGSGAGGIGPLANGLGGIAGGTDPFAWGPFGSVGGPLANKLSPELMHRVTRAIDVTAGGEEWLATTIEESKAAVKVGWKRLDSDRGRRGRQQRQG